MSTEEHRNLGITAPDRDRIAHLVVDNAVDFAILTIDLEAVGTSWSPGAERLLGWTEAEMVGADVVCIIFTPEDRARRGL